MDKIVSIDNANYIKRLFRKIAKMQSIDCYVIDKKNKIYKTELKFVDKKGANFSIKDIDIDMVKDVGFFYKNVYFSFETKKGNLFFEKPTLIKISNRRFLERLIVNNSFVLLENESLTLKVKDITTKGLSFFSTVKYLKNTSLKVILNIDKNNFNTNIIIKNIRNINGKNICGAEFVNLNYEKYKKLIHYILFNKYVYLDFLGNYKKEEVEFLYNDAGYFDNEEGIRTNFETVYLNNISINKPFELFTNFCIKKNDILLTTSGIAKIYSKTFLAQHLAAIPSSRRNLNFLKNVYTAMGETAYSNPRCYYVLLYLDFEKNKWNKEIYEYITKENSHIEKINIYKNTINVIKKRNIDDKKYRIFKTTKIKNFLEYISNLSDLEVGCYDLKENLFFLKELNKLYEDNNLYCKRNLYKIVNQENITISYIIADIYSSGLNLANLVDTCKFYIEKKYEIYMNDIVAVSLPKLELFYKFHNKKYFYIMVKNQICFHSDLNLKKSFNTHRCILNKQGVKEFIDNVNLLY